jgi:formylglycine-generating enzyme required for sulfatase activity
MWLPLALALLAQPETATETIPGTTVKFELVRVPSAKLPDGTEAPVFWIGKTEVTWDEFERWYLTPRDESVDAITRPSPAYEPYDRGWGRGRRPAVGISFHAAKTYCEWLSKKTGRAFRLPTEAEWERAARAGAPGETLEPLAEHAWFQENADGKTQEVGRKRANALGLHDALGNAWEYCVDPAGAPVLRGGSWKDPASTLRFATRQAVLPKWNERDPQRPRSRWWIVDGPFVGFRVARGP